MLHSNVTGLAECYICPEGQYCNGGDSRIECPKGYYCPSGSHDGNWKKCPPGTWLPEVSSLLATLLNEYCLYDQRLYL